MTGVARTPAGSPEAARGVSTTINQINQSIVSRDRDRRRLSDRLTDARFSSYCGFVLGYVLLTSSAFPY